MNPMQMLKTLKNNGNNPQQFIMSMLGNNNNPIIGNLINMAKSGKNQSVEQFARNYFKEQRKRF